MYKIIFFFLAFSLFFFIPVKVSINFSNNNSNLNFCIEIHLLKIIKIIVKVARMKVKIITIVAGLKFQYIIKNKNNYEKNKGSFLRITQKYKNIFLELQKAIKKLIRLFIVHIKVIQLFVYISYGSKNPAFTGLLAGYIWSAVCLALRILYSHMKFDGAKVKINVTPVFTKYEPLKCNICCIFQVRIGHIIITAAIFLWQLVISFTKHKLMGNNVKSYFKEENRAWMNTRFRV